MATELEDDLVGRASSGTLVMGQPRLLLVEDEPSMAAVVAALGRRGGHRVDWCSSVPEAWAQLETARPDLVLLDVQLPGPSGVELCRKARATQRLATLPIALFTHWGLSATIAEGLEAGVDFLVTKDLAGQPARWLERLAELLPSPDGRLPPRLVKWERSGTNPPCLPRNGDWIVHLQQALRRGPLRDTGPEVLSIVLRRALKQAFGFASEAVIASWIGSTARPDASPPVPSPDALLSLVAALADQVWRIFGTEAASPCWAALAEIVPGAPEFAN
jgi:CheY-like chemotaxis protein